MATQAQYTKAKELQERADLETISSTKPEVVDSELWGTYATKLDNTERDLITETVRLQGECQAYTAALHVATSALEDITEKVEASRKQKQDLDEKIELMNQFEERQDEIVGRIRQFYGRNQELIQVLARKQSRLLEVVQQDLCPRVQHETDNAVTRWQRLSLEELRRVSGLAISRLDTVGVQVSANHSIEMPFEDLHIHQIQERDTKTKRPNGFSQLLAALQVPSHAGWPALLAELTASEHESDSTMVTSELKNLERDISEDQVQTVPSAGALIAALHELSNELKRVSLTRMKEVVETNSDTAQRWLPKLQQTIDNWQEQPAWAVRTHQ
ncbi:hypothetical protein PINS_up002748 [Pythium insidiosum]|nr:hypothetical protein PINS_up002748 [Pythium insidiosum]